MGSTDNFLPGSWKAAAAVGDSETAAAEPEACAAEGVSAEGVPAEGVEGVGAGVVVTEFAAAEVVPDGMGTDETPITTIGGEPVAEGERVDADTEAVADTGTVDRPITTMPDPVAVAEVGVVTEEDATEEVEAPAPVVEGMVALDLDTVDAGAEAVAVVEALVVVEALADVEAGAAVDDEPPALVLEGGAVAEAEDDACMVTVHVFTCRTASLPCPSLMGVNTITQVSVSAPSGVFVT